MTDRPVPLVDLSWQHRKIAPVIEQGFRKLFERGDFVLGEPVANFESEFASYSGVPYCVGVANGTDALELSLRALGVGRGDEVVVPSNSFIASAVAVVRAGGIPVLVDCTDDTALLDVGHIVSHLSPRTKVVMAVHLYGQLVDIQSLRDVVGDVPVLEDAAQAQGAELRHLKAGALGDIAGTSFYPGKNLGAYGDAGAVLTSDAGLAAQVRRLGNLGTREKYSHPTVGFNSRLDSIQAIVLSAKLAYLDQWNLMRERAAWFYDQLLDDLEQVVRPTRPELGVHVWHLYVVRVPRRDEVFRRMRSMGIGVGIHYPTPIHMQGAMRFLGHKEGDFPTAERLAQSSLSLPLYPGISESQQERVVQQLREAIVVQSRERQ